MLKYPIPFAVILLPYAATAASGIVTLTVTEFVAET